MSTTSFRGFNPLERAIRSYSPAACIGVLPSTPPLAVGNLSSNIFHSFPSFHHEMSGRGAPLTGYCEVGIPTRFDFPLDDSRSRGRSSPPVGVHLHSETSDNASSRPLGEAHFNRSNPYAAF